MKMPKEGQKVTFIEGIKTYCGAGQPDLKVIIKVIKNLIIEWIVNSLVFMQCKYGKDGLFLCRWRFNDRSSRRFSISKN